jgi:hypothetical protein
MKESESGQLGDLNTPASDDLLLAEGLGHLNLMEVWTKIEIN